MRFPVCFFLVALLLQTYFAPNLQSQVTRQDSIALVDLFNSTSGPDWTNNSGWLTATPVSKWFGVEVFQGRVTGLDLDSNNLVGTLPASLGNLDSLTFLAVRFNQLRGQIPVELGNLKVLSALDLRNNQLTGSIPPELGGAVNLFFLGLGSNQLSGPIPAALFGLSNLQKLFLEDNQLSGPIPADLAQLSQLDELFLRGNQLSGSIPASLGSLSKLQRLVLDRNQLSGNIPPELGGLANLTELYLGANQLVGAVPLSFTGLSNLQILSVHTNALDELPDFANVPSLSVLEIQNNRFTFEDIEPNIGVPTFIYAPQDSVGQVQTLEVTAGEPVTFRVQVGGSNNQYQWLKDGTEVPGLTSDTVTIQAADTSQAGVYICRITNPVAPLLTLFSRPITLVVIGAKPTVVTQAADDVGADTATLRGSVNANGLPTTVWFEYGPDTNYGEIVLANPDTVTGTTNVAVSAELFELESSTTYHFRVAAANNAGTAFGADQTFTTLGVPALTLSRTTVDFGTVPLGQVAQDTLVLQNIGTATLNVSSLRVSGADAAAFSLASGDSVFSLASGDFRILTLLFAPTTPGSKSAALEIVSDAPDSPHTVTLRGRALQTGLADTPWPKFRHDNRNTGRSELTGPEQPKIDWTFSTGDTIVASVTLGNDGTLYLGDFSGVVYALNPDGTLKWTFDTGAPILGSAAADKNGTGYVGSTNGIFYALSPQGQLRWSFEANFEEPGDAPFELSSPAVADDGTVYVGNGAGELYALTFAGRRKWSFFLGNVVFGVVASPAIADDGTVYIGSRGLTGALFALNPDGTQRWVLETGGFVDTSPAVAEDGTVYFGSSDRFLRAATPDGKIKWLLELDDALVSSPALGADGTVYLAARNGRVYAVNPDGTLKWHFDLDGQTVSSPALDANDVLYIASEAGTLYALNPDGSLKWTFPLDAPTLASPTIGPNERIYIGTQAGELLAIGPFQAAPPQVSVPQPPREQQPAEIVVTPPAGFSPTTGQLFFRRGGETSYQSASLTPSGTDFLGTIPPDFVTLRGAEYYVVLSDGTNEVTFPATNPQQNPAVLRVNTTRTQFPLNLSARVYKMVSVPLELQNPAIDSVLADDYGPTDVLPRQWRIFRFQNDAYAEHTEISAAFTPGTAFWLITRNGDPFDVENGQSVSTAGPASLTLQPGWNQIADPFAFPVDWGDITATGSVQPPVFFDGTEYQFDVLSLEPWEGYFVFNLESTPVTLTVPPTEGVGELNQAKRNAHTRVEFVLQLAARVPHTRLRDTQNFVGLAAGASEGLDPLDRLEPPAIGEFVRLTTREAGYALAHNFKPRGKHGQLWDLELSTSAPGVPVELTVQTSGTLPEGFEYWLFDLDSGEEIGFESQRAAVGEVSAERSRRLKLVVGGRDLAEQTRADLPGAFALWPNYPNPFNPSTTIRYRLPQARRVTLAIFNLQGQRVRTLVNVHQEAGLHRVTWDGRDQQGRRVASGVYLYRLVAGAHRATRKLVLIR